MYWGLSKRPRLKADLNAEMPGTKQAEWTVGFGECYPSIFLGKAILLACAKSVHIKPGARIKLWVGLIMNLYMSDWDCKSLFWKL